MPENALPGNLRGRRHNDWIWPLRWVPRAWTAHLWGSPSFVAGNLTTTDFGVGGAKEHPALPLMAWGPRPITAPGTWQVAEYSEMPEACGILWAVSLMIVPCLPGWWTLLGLLWVPWSPFYVAWTTRGGTHVRLGPRWDDVDGYVEWPEFAIKRGIR